MRPLLSIVIPTRYRADLAIGLARQLLSVTGDGVEVIVRDSSEVPVTRQQLGALSDARFLYESGPPVSMTENWNRALALANGEYVCVIGDDDGVTRSLMPIVEWAAAIGADAVVFPYAAVFYWPDFPDQKAAGRLFLGASPGGSREMSAKDELLRYIRSTEPVTLPRLYHGVVRRECLETLRRKTGQFLHTIGADDYVTYALCTLIDRYYIVDAPITIAGKCRNSDSGRFAVTGDASVLVSGYAPGEQRLDRRAPPSTKAYSLRIDAIVTALQHAGADELLDEIVRGRRYASWYALSLRTNLTSAVHAVRHLWSNALSDQAPGERARVVGRVGQEFSAHAFRKLYRQLGAASGRYSLMVSGATRQSIYEAADIAEAVAIVERESGPLDASLLKATVDRPAKNGEAASRQKS